MKKLKTFVIIIMCLCLGFSGVSCSNKDYSDKTVVFATVDSVSTFDPQLCETSAEISIATNSFEGLMTKNENGEVVNGAIESYETNASKTVYTFKIKDSLVWSDGETVLSAADFAFGIKRAILKETESPFASALFCIKNAKAVNKGEKSLDALGVYSNNENNTLTIELNESNEGFLEILTKPMCFPCNEAFFYKTNGKYGLSNKYIISNGAFSINYYNPDTKTAIIQRNDDYKGDFGAVPKQITINYNENYEDIYNDFQLNEVDVAVIDSSYIKSLEELDVNSKLFYNTNYCLYMSESLVSKYGNDLNRALSVAISYDSIKKNISDSYKEAEGIVPQPNLYENRNYRNIVGNVSLPQSSITEAQKILGDYDAACEMLNGLSIYHPEDNERLSLISNIIIQGWQKDLNLYINSTADTQESILYKIK